MKDARPVIGLGSNHGGGNGPRAGFGTTPMEKAAPVTGAAHPDAARFVGWDRASRPGWEPIIVAVKPLRGTIAETALRYGTGGMNADGCRIPRASHAEVEPGVALSIDPRGGFPANVIMDEEAAAELDRQSGHMRDGVAVKSNTEVGKVTGRVFKRGNTGVDQTFGGGGGASRFFYTAKASTSERDKGLEDLPTLAQGAKTGRDVVSAGVAAYAGDRGGGHNPHPTVKPISLMRYLVRRASPPGAWDPDMVKRPVVLDCFMGSGSTGVAAMVEGVRFVGCELGEESAEVARLRLQHAYALPREDGEAPVVTRVGGQGKLF
jgi:site-specific DNA-methyltransferase (adenine-specific)